MTGSGSPEPPDADVRAAWDAVRAVRRGDHDAFGRIVKLYHVRLYGVALMMTRDPVGAEEVTQDAFVRAYEKLDRYDESRPFYPWLATIAVRIAQNWLRRRGRIDRREGAEPTPESHEAGGEGPLRELIADERNRRLWRAVEELPSGQRTAVVLHYREGMKVKEIARALGVTSGTVKTQLHRARSRLAHRDDLAAAFGWKAAGMETGMQGKHSRGTEDD